MMMIRGPIADEGFKGQFSGHETFPLRTLWLRKAFDAVADGAPKTVFSDPEAIVRFGVGKNMALAIRYWALACDVIRDVEGQFRPTLLGTFLFRSKMGWDPNLEHDATLWLLHWQVASRPNITTTWYWAFNHVASPSFDQAQLTDNIYRYTQQRQWARVAPKTVARDVECFLRSYLQRHDAGGAEDHLEAVLAELGLLQVSSGRVYTFRRGPKPRLPDAVFAYALDEFWQHHAPNTKTLSVEAVTYEPGSPGQVFKLDEESVVERLSTIADVTGREMRWSDTAGVRQVARRAALKSPFTLLAQAYRVNAEAVA